jgi:RNA polymerase sigma factor (sigma-70 family)
MEPRNRKNPLLDQIRRMATMPHLRQMPDRELLAQFVGQHDEAAFRILMDRYGPMVLRVCKRILGNDHDAEDAYQATFVVLTSEAGAHRCPESVAAWLHSVAVRIAGNARRAAQCRRLHEQQALEKKVSDDPLTDLSMREAYGLLEEEMSRLPDKYRLPLIQCELMGRHRDEVARELGCSVYALKHRLEYGKKLLQKRLTARGLTMTGLMLSLMLSRGSEAATVPPVLAANTLRTVLLFASGQKAAAVSPEAIYLAGQAIKEVVVAQIRKRVIGVVLALTLAVGGMGAWQIYAHRADPTSFSSAPTYEAPAARDSAPPARGTVARPEAPVQGDESTALIRGKVLDAAGRMVPFAPVTALVRRPFRPGEHGLRDEVVARGQADEQGTFRLRVPADFPTWSPERQVVLVAKAPGHAPITSIVCLTEQGATEVDLRLAAERVVRGRLLAPDGSAAPGVRLRVIRLGDVAREIVQGVAEHDGPDLDWPGPVVSDAEGRFNLSGVDPKQGVWLQVEDDRYAPDAFGLLGADGPPDPSWQRYDPDAFGLRGADKPTEIRLKAAQVLEGRVVAADTGKAVAGVKFTAPRARPYLMPGRFTVPDYLSISARVLPPTSLDAVSGADGSFRLRPLVGAKTILQVHPPPDSPYLAVCKQVDWSEGVVRQTLAVALPRGVVVRGRVVDEDGTPVAGASVQFGSPMRGNPEHRPDVIQERDRIVLAGKDGRFSLTVPAGPVRLMAHGPTHEYQAHTLRYWSVLENDAASLRWGWREPLPGERWFHTHAELPLNLTLAEHPAEVRLRLVRGETVAGRVVAPDGAPVQTAVLLCGEKVSPLQNGAVQPLPVREGRYELPGCVAGQEYPVLFLDAVKGWGAAVDLGAGGDAGPEVKLARCGSARLRLLDAKGRPLAGRGLSLVLVIERSFPASQPPPKRTGEGHYNVCYDPRHYCTDPVSDGEGWLTLPALIPGARYTLEYADAEGVWRFTPEFRVEPGEQLHLPDLAIRDR